MKKRNNKTGGKGRISNQKSNDAIVVTQVRYRHTKILSYAPLRTVRFVLQTSIKMIESSFLKSDTRIWPMQHFDLQFMQYWLFLYGSRTEYFFSV